MRDLFESFIVSIACEEIFDFAVVADVVPSAERAGTFKFGASSGDNLMTKRRELIQLGVNYNYNDVMDDEEPRLDLLVAVSGRNGRRRRHASWSAAT